MNHQGCPSEPELSAFRAGSLSADAFERLANHLETCDRCLSALEKAGGGDDPFLAALRGPLPSDPFRQEPQCQQVPTRFRATLEGGLEDTVDRGSKASSVQGDEQQVTLPFVNPAIGEQRINLGRYENLGIINKGGMGSSTAPATPSWAEASP